MITADGYKIVVAKAIGPASAISVPAGSTATVDLSIQPNPSILLEVVALKSITGLPSGLALAAINYEGVNVVKVGVYNCTDAAISVTANSVTAEVVCKAY